MCWTWATFQERSTEWRLLQAAACSIPQPPSIQGPGTLRLGERKGKSVVSPACKGHGECSSGHHSAILNITVLLLISFSGGKREAPLLAQEAGGILSLNLPVLLLPHTLLPVVPEVLPAAAHPCPCMGPLCCPAWHPHGQPMVCPLPYPSWLLPLLKSHCAEAPHEADILACCGVLHWLQR